MKLKVLIVLLILFFIGTIIGFWQVQKLRSDNLSLQRDLQELEKKKRGLEMRLKEKEEEILKLLSEIEEKNQQIDSLEEQIRDEKAKYEEAILQLKNKEEEIAKERERSLELENRLNRREIEFKFLLAKVKDLEERRADLEKKSKELEAKTSKVELGKIEVKGTKDDIEGEISPQRLEGKILVVNRDYDFAVINLGKLDGLNVSDILSVWSQNEYLGDVKVEKLRDRMSAVGFLDKGMEDKIKEGDRVIFPSQ